VVNLQELLLVQEELDEDEQVVLTLVARERLTSDEVVVEVLTVM